MGTAALYNAFVVFFQLFECGNKGVYCGEELVFNFHGGCNVQCRWEGVVGRLAHVNVVIRVAELFACNLVGTVCNNLVCVHIALGAATCLPYNEREVVVQ